MKVLGISNCQTSSVCLFIDGYLKCAVSEERFTRKKLDDSFPINSINFILKKFNMRSISNIDYIAYSWSKGLNFDTGLDLLKRIELEKKINKKNIDILKNRIKIETQRDRIKRKEFDKWILKNNLKKKLITFYHHEAHALSATLLSKFENAICFTADGRGDYESSVIWDFNRKRKNPLKKIKLFLSNDSLGYFYARITGLLGFEPNRHEGKITGLAAYGKSNKTINLMKKMIDFKQKRLIANNGVYYMPYFKPYSKKLIQIIKRYKKEDIASGAQKHLENITVKILKTFVTKKKYNLCLAGGVISNVKLNGELKKIKNVKKVFVQPQMSDGGLCLGAAAGCMHKLGYKIKPMTSCSLGFENNPKSIKFIAKKFKLKEIKGNVYRILIENLKKGKVIGVIKDKMEFGPRALMNRSIILKTSDVSCNNWLNKKLNRTEFMPFAPVTTDNLAKISFKNFSKSDDTFKFMTSTTNVTKKFKSKSPAVCHIDGTARPQIVDKKSNRFFYDLINKWNKETGELSLINTSFNSHEEPIVRTYEDGIRELKKKVIDLILLENKIFIR